MVLPQLESKYHVCVNPDVFLDSDVLSRMARYMDGNEGIGMITPKIRNRDGSMQVLPKKNPRLIYLIARRIHLNFLKKYRREYEMLDMNTDQRFDIEFCSGCFMFMRTALFLQAGGFDERYFMYFEDADLTRRIRKWARAEYNPDFSVYHCWERAGGKKLKFFLIQVASMFQYMIKWSGQD
jgi:Predicted glycosyltransferases